VQMTQRRKFGSIVLLLLLLPPPLPPTAAAIDGLMRGWECTRVCMGALLRMRACQLLQTGRGGGVHGSADGTRCRRHSGRWQQKGPADHAVGTRAADAFPPAPFICNSCRHASSPFRAHQRLPPPVLPLHCKRIA
jgi:hypothetical protein